MDTRTQPLPVVVAPHPAADSQHLRPTPSAGRLSVVAGVVALIALVVVLALNWATVVSAMTVVGLIALGLLVLTAALLRLALGSTRGVLLFLLGVVVGRVTGRRRTP
ncbi:hypothetical protein [Curtobacterium sp. VKM Ac-2922]|uniref:hypothetical protein n=1 Tax=Curtobacterium sp. VKM Ac-2922 TaxID=2929475 RepID=UPI001FB22197|nr:hypothetical protein [Curtobacterium sp. VKM Ac-2922]MCJ1714958.1 hypothetical protein [Curtobacterium sp. VKM Ac-2922]